jgi:hypothetical protein
MRFVLELPDDLGKLLITQAVREHTSVEKLLIPLIELAVNSKPVDYPLH